MSSSALNLSDLSVGMPGLTSAKGESLAEAAAVCLENRQHNSGVLMQASGNFSSTTVHWDAVTPQQIAGNADLQDATEDGATAIVILAVRAQTGKLVMERAVKGFGFDYWLGSEDQSVESALPFQNLTRLEVSGILNGTTAQLNARVNTKLAQIEPTDDVCPAIIGVVEFSGPQIHLEGE
jgi:hypothetical protein